MIEPLLHTAHIAVTVLIAGAAILLGFLFYASSLTSVSPFTVRFLRILAVGTALLTVEVFAASYRTSRMAPLCVPLDGAVIGLVGRTLELIFFMFMTWFLLRPETKKALNGATAVQPASKE